MLRQLTFFSILCVLLPHLTADENSWTVGFGVVSSDISPGEERPIFPSVRVENKQYMFIPNLSYQWGNWSLGADGIGWQYESLNGLKTNIKAGYPRSSASIGGQKGWFRYGIASNLSYSDGIDTTNAITAGPITYSATLGLAERSEELSQKVSLGFPLFLSQKNGITVIGSGYLQQDNAAFSQFDLELEDPMAQDDYLHSGINVFGVYQATPQVTFLLSGTLQFNDDRLVAESEFTDDVQFNIFTLFSYTFGN